MLSVSSNASPRKTQRLYSVMTKAEKRADQAKGSCTKTMGSKHPLDQRWERQPSDTWKATRRIIRSRRPLLMALCCMVMLIYFRQPVSQLPRGQPFVQREPILSFRDRRSLHERLHIEVQDDGYKPSLDDGYEVQQKVFDPDRDDRLLSQEHKMLPIMYDTNVESDKTETLRSEKPQAMDDMSKVASKAGVKDDADGLDDEEEHEEKPSKQEEKAATKEEPVDFPKGPVNVQAELDPKNQKAHVISSPGQPAKEKVIELEPEEHLTLEETGESLPEVVHVTFEDAVKGMKLAGWEDEWIARASYDVARWGKLEEPKIDFVYLWVNGSEEAFQTTKRPYEMNSVLNDGDGAWIRSHGINRYRDWDELRYSVRSVEKFAPSFRNTIQIIVNSVKGSDRGKQVPTWLNSDSSTQDVVKVLAQEDIFDEEKHVCLPTFNSLTIENQLFNTPSNTDFMYAMSDDMLLGRPHAASDIVSPLFGPVMGFKSNSYNTVNAPTDADAHRFGEKPFLIYTSWLLNRRFGIRKRKGQGHFGHSLSRSLMREAIGSFPGPELQSACKRFRGEPGFQLYSWFVTFHYLIERHREALLWSFIMIRSDVNDDGFLSWAERQVLMKGLELGMGNEGKASFRKRNFYHFAQLLEKAGLEGPKVNTDIQWTSLDGPSALMNLDCAEFDVNECLAPGFSISTTDSATRNPVFSTAVIFERVARQRPQCGDCLLKLILNQVPHGLEPLLPHPKKQPAMREIVVKALIRYQYTIADTDSLFVMTTDADQVESTLTSKFVRGKREMPGQLCLNDDVTTEDAQELQELKDAISELYEGLFPDKSRFEI